MSSSFLRNQGCIAGEQDKNGSSIWTSTNLSSLENLSSADVGIGPASDGIKLDVCLGVLPAVEAHISKQLLDCIVQAPKIEY